MQRDTQIFDLIQKERERQTKGIELIASENFVSDQVMEAMGSVMICRGLSRKTLLWRLPGSGPERDHRYRTCQEALWC